MTPAQKEALRAARKRLKASFEEARLGASMPGQARIWFVTYLSDTLESYENLRNRVVDGRRLSKVLSKDPKKAISKLLKRSCDRDLRTTSRWAAALVHAHKLGITPQKLRGWLQEGGGVAGRAAEVAIRRQRLAPGPAKEQNQPPLA